MIAHFILKETPDASDHIEEHVDEWFRNFEGSTYQGDCMTAGKFRAWFETYFEEIGCNEQNLLPHIKELALCLYNKSVRAPDEYALFLFENYSSYLSCNIHYFSSRDTSYFMQKAFSKLEEINSNYIAKDAGRHANHPCEIEIDFKRIEKCFAEFDKEFSRFSDYDLNHRWINAYVALVAFIFCSDNPFYKFPQHENESFCLNLRRYIFKFVC